MNKTDYYIPKIHLEFNKPNPQKGKRLFESFIKSHANYGENLHGLEIVQVIQIDEEATETIGLGFTIDVVPNGKIIATCAHCLDGEYAAIVTPDDVPLPIESIFGSKEGIKNDIAFVFVRSSEGDQKVRLPIAEVLTNGELAGAYNRSELGAVELKTLGNIPSIVATANRIDGFDIHMKQDNPEQNQKFEYGLLDGLSQEGSSGSPVFTDKGVVGMVFAGLEEDGFTLYLPIQYILHLYENQVKPQILKL